MRNLYIAFTLLVALSSCKKDPVAAPSTTTTTGRVTGTNATATGTRRELTLDSIYLYAKQIYYWNDALPSYDVFNPRKYTSGSAFDSYKQALFDLTQYSTNPATGKPYEFVANSVGGSAGYAKYSYITQKSGSTPIAYIPNLEGAVDLEGNGLDMGLSISSIGTSSSYEVRIKSVNQNSPADKAGLSRGDVITRVNGTSVGSNYNSEVNLINSALNSTSARFAGRRTDGTSFDITLNRASYRSSPIFRDTIVVSNGKKVGYVAYARFSSAGNSVSALNAIFSAFASAGVNDLVVDLRYNGGGYVSTAEHFTNLIAPSSLNGKTMFREKFNTLMQSGGASILKNQPALDANGKVTYSGGKIVTYDDYSYTESANSYNFKKAGSLNSLQKVVFIISGSTASASEMLINNLRPHMDVKTVGKTSYGKPVGFFPIVLENAYEVYYSMFTSINSAGQTDYFAGFTPDWDAADDVTRNFGDPQETCFAAALNYITRNSFISANGIASVLSVKGATVSSASPSLQIRDMNDDNSFRGMVETRLKMK